MYIFVFSIIQIFFLSVKLANAFSPYYLELLQEFRSTILARANRPLHSIRTERFKFIAKWFRFGKNSAGSSNSQIFFSPDTCLSSSPFFVCAPILPFKYIKSICNLFELLKTFILDLYIIDLININLSKITSWAKYDQEIKYFLSNENRFLMVRTQCVLLVIWNDIFFEFGSKKFSKFNNDAVKIVEHLIIASTFEMLVDIFLLIQIMLQYIKEWMKLSLIHRTIHTHDSITWIDIYVTRIDCTWIDRDNREIN